MRVIYLQIAHGSPTGSKIFSQGIIGMSDTSLLPRIRVQRLAPIGTHAGVQKSPTSEDEKTPPKKSKKSVLKKSVSFENGVKGGCEEGQSMKK